MSTKISALPAASGANINDASYFPLDDNTATTVRATIAQVRTQICATSLNVTGSVTASLYMFAGSLGSGTGGNYRCVSDDGVTRWAAGITGSAGDKNWVLYDIAGGAPRITVDRSTGVVTLANGVTSSGLVTIPSTVASAAGSGTDIVLGATTQSTIGANGGASALTANPLGYLVFYKGTTKCVVPFYNG